MKSKMLKMIMLVTVFMLTMACGSKSADGKKKYTIGIDTSFPPFEYKKDSKYTGIDIELLQAIGKLEGFEVEFKPMDFGGLIPALQSGQLDGVIAGASITEERKKSVDFSDPYYDTGIVAIVHKDNNTIKTGKDLVGKRPAVKSGTAGERYVQENLKGKSEVRIYDDTVSMLKAVENKQADAGFEDLPVVLYTLNQDPDTQLKVGTGKLTNVGNGFMVKKGTRKDLVEELIRLALKRYNDRHTE